MCILLIIISTEVIGDPLLVGQVDTFKRTFSMQYFTYIIIIIGSYLIAMVSRSISYKRIILIRKFAFWSSDCNYFSNIIQYVSLHSQSPLLLKCPIIVHIKKLGCFYDILKNSVEHKYIIIQHYYYLCIKFVYIIIQLDIKCNTHLCGAICSKRKSQENNIQDRRICWEHSMENGSVINYYLYSLILHGVFPVIKLNDRGFTLF